MYFHSYTCTLFEVFVELWKIGTARRASKYSSPTSSLLNRRLAANSVAFANLLVTCLLVFADLASVYAGVTCAMNYQKTSIRHDAAIALDFALL